MADFNEQMPEWNDAGIEPPKSKKDAGWQVNDKPPAGWLNWLFNRTYKVLAEIRSVFSAHAGDNDRHVTSAKQAAWDSKETPAGAQAKANAARDAATLAADAAADAAEAAAKAASIPVAQKGVAGGVPALNAASQVIAKGADYGQHYVQDLGRFQFSSGIANQKVDVFITGQLIGYLDISIGGTWHGDVAVGNLTKRIVLHTQASETIDYQESAYISVNGRTREQISISDLKWDTGAGKWKVSIEARSAVNNVYSVFVEGTSTNDSLPTLTLGQVYTGAAAALPMAVQTIPDDTVTHSGFKVWNSGNDGAGSGLDADMISGLHSYDFARAVGYTNFGGNNRPVTTADFVEMLLNMGAFSSGHWVGRGSWSYGENVYIKDSGFGNIHLAGAVVELTGVPGAYTIRIITPSTSGVDNAGNTINSEFIYSNNGAAYLPGWRKVWNSRNMGSGSGLDADTVIGKHADDLPTPNTIVTRNGSSYAVMRGLLLQSQFYPEIVFTESDNGMDKNWYQLVEGGVLSFREDNYTGERMQLNSNGMRVNGAIWTEGDFVAGWNAQFRINTPKSEGTGGWARGVLMDDQASNTLGGVGIFGGGDFVENLFLAHGQYPWDSGLGLYVRPNGYVGVKNKSPAYELHIAGWAGASRFISDIPTGVSPIQVNSTTVVENLNTELHGGKTLPETVQGTLSYAVTTGTASGYAAIFNPAVAMLTPGLRVTIKAHAGSVGPITLAVNGLEAKPIKKPNGNNPPLALGGVYTLVYDGSAFILQGEGGEYGTAQAAHVLGTQTFGTEYGVAQGAMPLKQDWNGDGTSFNHHLAKDVASTQGTLWLRPVNPADPPVAFQGDVWIQKNDPNFNPAYWRNDVTMFGLKGTMPVITSGQDPAQGVGIWPDGGVAVYPAEGYRKGGSGAGEIKVTPAQLNSVGYVRHASGSQTAVATPVSRDQNNYTTTSHIVMTLPFAPKMVIITGSSSGYFSYYLSMFPNVITTERDGLLSIYVIASNPISVGTNIAIPAPGPVGFAYNWEAWG